MNSLFPTIRNPETFLQTYTQNNQTTTYNTAKAELINKMKQLGSFTFTSTYHDVSAEISKMRPQELQILLCDFFKELANESPQDAIAKLDILANMISVESLLDSSSCETIVEAFETAKINFEEAKNYYSILNEFAINPIKREIIKYLNGIINLIGTIAGLLDITRFANPEQQLNETQLQARASLTIQLFTLLATIAGTYTVSILSGPITAGIILCVAAFSAAWKYIRPKPNNIGGFRNLNESIQFGELKASNGNRKLVQKIARVLSEGKCALIVAPTRSGKTESVEAFAKNIVKGVYDNDPLLKKQTVHYINTSDLNGVKPSQEGNGAKITLENISNQMGKYADEITLVFDEIHNAYTNQSPLGELLKTRLGNKGKFPHVIAMTTEKEYPTLFAQNEGFGDRFVKIEVENTEINETLGIMSEWCIRNNIEDIYDEEALKEIYNVAAQQKDARFPNAAIQLLKSCVAKTQKSEKSESEISLDDLIARKSERLSLSVSSSNKKESVKVIQYLNAQIIAAEDKVRMEKPKIEKLYKARDQLTIARNEMFKTALKISSVATSVFETSNYSTTDKDNLKRILLLDRFMRPSFKNHIKEKANNLDVSALITRNLIFETAGQKLTKSGDKLQGLVK